MSYDVFDVRVSIGCRICHMYGHSVCYHDTVICLGSLRRQSVTMTAGFHSDHHRESFVRQQTSQAARASAHRTRLSPEQTPDSRLRDRDPPCPAVRPSRRRPGPPPDAVADRRSMTNRQTGASLIPASVWSHERASISGLSCRLDLPWISPNSA
jgi:hypothetical protein